MMHYERLQFEQLPDDAPEEHIRLTAEQLQRYQYEPLFLFPTPRFIWWRKEDMVREYDRLTALADANGSDSTDLMTEEAVQKQLGLLLYHYRLLCRLREQDAEAWDVLHALYEDD